MFFDITKTLTLGLLGLGSIVSGLPAKDATVSVAERDHSSLLSRGLDSKIKLSEIADNLSGGGVQAVDPTKDTAKSIYDGKWFIKTTGNFNNEITVYQSIDDKGIAPKFVAQIVAEDSDDIIGFATENVDGSQAEDDDKGDAVELIQKLHDAGWSHGDAHKGNFIKTTFSMYLIDFEESVEDDEDANNEDFAMLDQEFGVDDDDDEEDWD